MAEPGADESGAIATLPPTFDMLCRRHGELLEAQAEERLDPQAARTFVADAAAAGVQIESVTERDGLRSIITYWRATLARLPVAQAAGAAPPDKSTEAMQAAATASEPPLDVASTTLASFDPSQSPDLDESQNPFVGLAAFDVGQSDVFFGRERVVDDLLKVVLENPLVVVSGASGTGKSSLVRAGLTGALRADLERADWTVAIASPGRDPIASLVAALASAWAGAEPSAWIEATRARLDTHPSEAGALVKERMGDGHLLLIIDQLEELFSLCPPEDRDRAASSIAAISALDRAHVVLTIRDEYLEGERGQRVLPALDLANAKEFRIPPLDASEIRAAIAEPAARAGLVFHDGLIDRIVAEVGNDPAALPLLQYSLLRMWQARNGNRITFEVYEKVGGPATALANAAQEIYDGFVPQAREYTRIIFQQLVRPSLIYEFVRDRVSRLELERLLPGDNIRTVIRPFVEAGLIVVTPGSDRSQDRIEIAHEALIRNWDLLRRWAGEVRDRERHFLEIDAQAERWEESGHSGGHLLIGNALKSAELAHKQYRDRARVDPVTNARVERYLSAGRRQQRRLLAGLAIIVIMAALLVLGGFRTFSLSSYNDKLAGIVRGTSDVITDIRAQAAAEASETMADEDAGRQFIQMLLTRGTIQREALPTAFADMTRTAAFLSTRNWQAPFDSDFLGTGEDISPTIRRPTRLLKLPNLRVFYDEAAGFPLLVISQSDRTAPIYPATPNALYRSQELDGQPDEQAVAQHGLALARLTHPREVAWGAQMANAARATNLLALMVPVGIDEADRRFSDWSRLTATLRATHNPGATRVLYFSGSVPGASRNSPPRRLWKVAVSAKDNRLVADAIMLPARSSSFQAAQTTLDQISAVSGVDFARLKAKLTDRKTESSANTPVATTAPGKPSSAAAGASSVYIQLRDVPDYQANVVRLALATEGLRVPPIQQVDACLTPQLRYYHDADAKAASRAAEITGTALRAAEFPNNVVEVIQLSLKRFPNAKQGNLELWLCGSKAAVKN